MAGKFSLKKFVDIDLEDAFFDSLKADYPGTESSTGFVEWFEKKAKLGATALVFEDEIGVSAFIVLKDNEEESISLQDTVLPTKKRTKISTIKITDRHQGQRIGEGAIGLVLWKWQQSSSDEIYVTVFDKHKVLISLFEKFGFEHYGRNANNELVYVRNKNQIDFSDTYRAFPFVKGGFDYAGYVIIDDNYHDTMFAYSDLANNKQELHKKISSSVTNGLTKIYVGQAPAINYKVGEPVLIYRKYTQGAGKRYRSCITSFGIVTDAFQAKVNGRELMTFDELKKRIGNKSVFNENELYRQFSTFKTVTIVELLYCGFFGAGNNVNMDWLDKNDCWSSPGQYPTTVHLSEVKFKRILMEGNVNVPNVIID
jgi:hypothetical protein